MVEWGLFHAQCPTVINYIAAVYRETSYRVHLIPEVELSSSQAYLPNADTCFHCIIGEAYVEAAVLDIATSQAHGPVQRQALLFLLLRSGVAQLNIHVCAVEVYLAQVCNLIFEIDISCDNPEVPNLAIGLYTLNEFMSVDFYLFE